MARRVPGPALALGLALALLASPAASGAASRASRTLVSYSFDDEQLATGPDTFAVFEKSSGRVRLSGSFKWSGFRAVEIRDVAGDGAFPELQGYFAPRRDGRLHAHFALLATNAFETFNLALAGPRGFTLQKDGIAFWMLSRGGFLLHYSDSMPKRLCPLRSFVWYLVDVAYDVEAGSYDLVIHEEGAEDPLVKLAGVANAPNQPGSALDKFSFIGDTGEDTSNVVYYVDDIVLSVDRPVAHSAFVAPGRRKLFVDAWAERQKSARRKLSCLPAMEPADLGFGPRAITELEAEGALASLRALLEGDVPESPDSARLSPGSRRLLEGASLHQRGCAALEEGRAAEALELFDGAARLAPEAPLHELSAALALARLSRFDEADARLWRLDPALRNDPPFALTAALIGLGREDLDEAERRLGRAADGASGCAPGGPVAEQYFFVLLWRGAYRKAERYAGRLAECPASVGGSAALWFERAGDAAFLAGEVEAALDGYTRSLGRSAASPLLLTKLSDVHFLLGDLDRERELREAVYGSLKEGE